MIRQRILYDDDANMEGARQMRANVAPRRMNEALAIWYGISQHVNTRTIELPARKDGRKVGQ